MNIRRILLAVALSLAGATLARAQGSVQIISRTGVGVTVTSSCSASHNCLDVALLNIPHVICDSGCSGGGGGGGTSSTFGAAFPATGTAAGFIDSGGNMAGGTLDAGGRLVVTGAGGTFPVTQSTSPWVVSLASTTVDLTKWAGTTLGTPTNFGTTPTAVIAGSVNASIFSGTTALGTPNTFGTTAPTGAALGVNSSLFIGTSLATSNSTTYTAKVAQDSNLLGTLGTAFTTAGFVDIKGADGNVFVRQTTASNLHTAATLDAETTKVLGTVRILGNGGATLDSTVGAGTAPANQQVVGALYNSTEISPTTGQAFALQADSKGRLRNVIMDAAGNTRGANVDANSNLGVVLPAETTKVLGTVRNLGNAGGVFDTTQNAAVPANALSMGCNFTTSPATVTTGNQGALQCNSKGEALVQLTDGTTNVAVIAGTTALKTDVSSVAGTATVTAGVNGMLAVGGNTATNVAITSDPVLIGAQGVSSENSAVTTARGVQLVADLVGKLITLPYANPENFVNGTTAAITDTTSTSTIASAGGSLRNYITSACVTNSHATVGTFVKILEGSNIIWEVYAAPLGGGACATFPVPLKGAAATAINCQPVTTGANVICTASGYKGI